MGRPRETSLTPSQRLMLEVRGRHTAAEFEKHDVDATMETMTADPHNMNLAVVFAEAQGLTVARTLAAKVTGVEPAKYPGVGTCYVETGRGMAAPAEISLLEPGGPRARMDAPSTNGLVAKAEFERERFARWFGG